MESQRLQYLLDQLNAGTCTGKELEEINEWFHNINQGHANIYPLIENAGGSEQLASELLNDFQARNKKPAKTRSFVLYYKLAAAVLTAAIMGAYLFVNRSTKPVQQQAIVQRSDSISPGSNKATLTLADGSTITLDNAANGQLAQQGDASIIKQRNGQLIYHQVAEPTGKPFTVDSARMSGLNGHSSLTFNTLVIPRGGQYQLTLPDGTKVWLNAATKLRYPVHFAANERRVELTGEAYFEVAHHANHPFRVVSPKQEVQVLGTHFNVKAYDD
ncbi:MAG TPA: FecR family protein, partial [Niastella sp.]|nr:FecR family protein [Niastella sp.]